jgi:hypothetical protein
MSFGADQNEHFVFGAALELGHWSSATGDTGVTER